MMWKSVVLQERLQVHAQNMYVFAFPWQQCYANIPVCYIYMYIACVFYSWFYICLYFTHYRYILFIFAVAVRV